MSDTNDAASKTEEPTPRRLEEARRKGDVAKSADFAQAASLAGALGALAILGGWMARNLAGQLTPFIEHPDSIQLEGLGAVNVFRYAIMAAIPVIAILMGASALTGVAGNLMQTGFLFTTDKLAPKLEKLSPLAGFKRLFGIDGLMQFFRALAKVVLTGAAAYFVLRPHVREFATLSALEPSAILPFGMRLARDLGFAILALMVAIGAFDWFWQRQRFMQRMRMTREELKEDFKQTDGDPHIKARLRQIRQERSRRRMIQAVPTATVVVMNPTHFAVALKYEAGETAAPECVAKGVDELALRIRAIAEEHGVPIVEDPPLARALFDAVEVDEAIPHSHYEAVAKVIGFVMNAAKSRPRARQL
jgi:flagellar biosynthetic protein FlhB